MEWTLPSSLTACVSAAPGLRLRPVPELGTCLAYDPARARLHRLNASAWLILSLCDGRPRAEIAADFAAAIRSLPGRTAGDRHARLDQGAFARGLALLHRLGLVVTTPQPPSPDRKETPR